MGLQEGWAPGSKSSIGWRGLKSPASCYTWAGLGCAVGTAGEDRAHGTVQVEQ